MEKQGKWGEYLQFSKRDRMGIGVLLVIIGLVFFLPRLLPPAPPPLPVFSDSSLTLIRKGTMAEPDDPGTGTGSFPDRTAGAGTTAKPDLFRFDPNTLDEAGWLRLGLRPRTVKTVLNYLSKGGKFRKPEDLQKVYGLSPALYAQLLPWVEIPSSLPAKTPAAETASIPKPVRTEKRFFIADINTADTSAFIALPGIGSKLAARIVAFREKLGGFYSVSQLHEVYGIADTVFLRIEPFLQLKDASVRKIRINEVGFDTLKMHPYFRYELAKAVIAYRNAHGPFRTPESLKQVLLITEDVFRKIVPYISCD